MNKELIKIWHNPLCSKSREAYNILEINPNPMLPFHYLDEEISKEQILDIMEKLGITDIKNMLRSKEDEYSKFDIDSKSQDEIIDIVLENHILIERPIIIKDGVAIIARPMENLTKLLA